MHSLPASQKSITLSNQKSNLNGIDLIKFICSILIVIVHIPPFQNNYVGIAKYLNFYLQHYLCRIGVPFFFVCSGYFLFRKMSIHSIDVSVIKNYCWKLLRLAGLWRVLLFMGSTGHLWYLGATVIAVILLSLAFHFNIKFKCICVIGFLLYLVGLLGEAYFGLIEPLSNITLFNYLIKGYRLAFDTTRNGVFMGFIFVLMGAAFSQYRINIKPLWSAIGFVLSMICMLVEVYLLESNNIPIEHNMYLFLLPAIFFLFSFASSIQLKDHALFKHLRTVGLLIYFLHLFVNEFVHYALTALNKFLHIGLQRYEFLFSLMLTVAFSVFIDWISGKKKFNWVSWLLT